MTKLAYLDCPTGIAGDMCLGALVSAGLPWEYLVEKLAGLGIEQEYHLRLSQVHHNGQLATKVDVDLPDQDHQHHHHQQEHHHEHSHEHSHEHHHEHRSGITEISTPEQNHHHHPTRHLPDIEKLITAAKLPTRVCQWTLAIFRKLAEAEGAVHGISPDKVHFHEVGATDAIIDIVGTCLGLDWLGIDQIYCSPLPTGGGTVWAAHGRLPVPVPAVLKLWESRQVPVYSNGIERELVTPTGAAIAVTLATSFGSPPAMTIQKIGNGAGSRQLPIPNMLRLWIGESSEALNLGKSKVKPSNLPPQTLHQSPLSANSSSANSSLETISVLETQIDDLNPQAIGYVFQELFNAGAVDVFTQGIGMKKSRPGILLSVICHPQDLEACQAVLFRETTTLGVRRLTQQRAILPREIQQVQTKYGQISVKVAWSDRSPDKTIMNVHPEYQDCAKLAKDNNCSWLEVHQLALCAWYSQYQGKGAGSRE